MSKTWEQEKAYRAKRADVLRNELNQAIKNKDQNKFMEIYKKLLSTDYMRAGERREFYRRFLQEVKS